ncbi:YjjG family noncanonical pyrimidine nucleotidase [Pedobacter sp. SAFR-022]|uniref:YjjG family noncanonical pyrimidine nucleotidase n=1 Tax=Pedobacter sp. SAFR-022 TaxID=3436861 RepID=UPI003F8155B8
MKKHIFFDLDHTIWDFDRNAEETLMELYQHYKLDEFGLSSAEEFILNYTLNNHALWADYHLGKISKELLRAERFKRTFVQMGILPELVPLQFEEDYVRLSPTKTNLFEGSLKVLEYLKQRYQLHIITNGFKETTITKMNLSGLNPYFQHVIISEDVGFNKPHPNVFQYAIDKASASLEESVMIGDSLEADIYGAQQFGMEAIFFNPLRKKKPADVTREIYHLEELLLHF